MIVSYYQFGSIFDLHKSEGKSYHACGWDKENIRWGRRNDFSETLQILGH